VNRLYATTLGVVLVFGTAHAVYPAPRGGGLNTLHEALEALEAGQPLRGRVPASVVKLAVARVGMADVTELGRLIAIARAGGEIRSVGESLVRRIIRKGGFDSETELRIAAGLPRRALAGISLRKDLGAAWQRTLGEVVDEMEEPTTEVLTLFARAGSGDAVRELVTEWIEVVKDAGELASSGEGTQRVVCCAQTVLSQARYTDAPQEMFQALHQLEVPEELSMLRATRESTLRSIVSWDESTAEWVLSQAIAPSATGDRMLAFVGIGRVSAPLHERTKAVLGGIVRGQRSLAATATALGIAVRLRVPNLLRAVVLRLGDTQAGDTQADTPAAVELRAALIAAVPRLLFRETDAPSTLRLAAKTAVVNGLQEEIGVVQAAAIESASRLNIRDFHENVLEFLTAENPTRTRLAALKVLPCHRAKTLEVLDSLLPLLSDPAVALQAWATLKNLTGQRLALRPDLWIAWRNRNEESLSKVVELESEPEYQTEADEEGDEHDD
jgi:hypothetical protein